MTKVATIGEILVEIMASESGNGFRQPVQLLGPFPSGAPAIFIDQVAKLGYPCGIISCVGDDDFGWVNLDRLRRDGVDVAAVEVMAGQTTGSAFVRYRDDGARDFVYNIKNSASGRIRLTEDALVFLGECDHLHVSGASLFSDDMADAVFKAVDVVKGNGGTISFDPNVRKEVMADPKVMTALRALLRRCDIFLPSGDELTLLTEADDPVAAVEELLASGPTAVVVKRGLEGASYFGADGRVDWPAYPVQEVDPTGAGDCFDATFVTCRLQGRGVEESLSYASAAGARAVTVRGPMEGTSDMSQLDAIRAGRPTAEGGRRLSKWLGRATTMTTLAGITSVCSAHPMVLEASMVEAASRGLPVLVEATCNQVNHQGGYTGLTPASFRDFVYDIAEKVSFPREQILLGGDHLGPNPWRDLPVEEAMREAELMVHAYVEAGFEKIHLDTSMGCRNEDDYVAPEVTAERAAELAVVAEAAAARAGTTLRYVIGTEVPAPGGAREEISQLTPTTPAALRATLAAHQRAFAAASVEAAYEQVIAVVAQPGVEFDDQKVVVYRPEAATDLSASLADFPGIVFEAHSTDYQPTDALAHLVRDGFGVLKVGPALTFALRQALYGLDRIAAELDGTWFEHSLRAEMERQMLADPRHWQSHYRGDPDRQRWLRHFSLSDRVRYYWRYPGPEAAVGRLMGFFGEMDIPGPLLDEFLPGLSAQVLSGQVAPRARQLLLGAVRHVLRGYTEACLCGPGLR